ncbi:MAG: DUF5050 domain-containing protein [Clostridiaceae bacterium]|nr:DUF5050 domain-containing protein [Clostridiaceae bacterium]
MYCSQCGKKISDESKFCSYCGNKLYQEKAEIINDTEEETTKNNIEEQAVIKKSSNSEKLVDSQEGEPEKELAVKENTTKRTSWIWTGIVVLVTAILAFILYFTIINNDINNDEMIAQQGEWIYYNDPNANGGLFKIRIDGSERIRLNNDDSCNLQIVGDWIYYNNKNYDNVLYKVRTDGSERIRMNNEESIDVNIVGDWIYYINGRDGNKIYKMDKDGNNKKKLNDDNAFNLLIVDEWIYYNHYDSDGIESSIYKMYTDGSKHTQLNANSSMIEIVDDWIYYENQKDEGNIYRMQNDGRNRTKIGGIYNAINIEDPWIYFSDRENGQTSKIHTSGKQLTKLTDDESINFRASGDWLYYINQSDDYKLYKIRKDGSSRTKLNNFRCHSINLLQDWLYCSTDEAPGFVIYKINKDMSLNEIQITENQDGIQSEEEILLNKVINAAYKVESQEIKLENGEYWGENQLSTSASPNFESLRIKNPIIIGDLNNDGLNDAVVSLLYLGGGSGAFDNIALYINSGDGSGFTTNSITLGDRIVISDISIKEGKVIVAYYEHAQDQAFADNPRNLVTKTLVLNNNMLEDVNSKPKPTEPEVSKRPFTKADCNVLGVKLDMPEAEIIKILGTPNNRTVREMDQEFFPGLSLVELEYSFGILYLMGEPGSGYLFKITITSDNVEGPRGIRVGDRIESALDKFPIEQDPVNNHGVLYSRDNSTGTFYNSNNEQDLTYYDGAGGYGDYGIGFKAVNGVITEIGVSVGIV